MKAAAIRHSVAYRPLPRGAPPRNDDCLTRSERTLDLFGVASVAEAAALAAAGPGSQLIVPRLIIGNATVAAARSADAKEASMTVHFIGAGPGAADLITVRGRDLIARSPVCLYAGSLVPQALLAHCPPGAEIVDTAPMTLDEIVTRIERRRTKAKTSRGCIRAIFRSGARSASSCAASTSSALPTRSLPACRRSQRRRRHWRGN